MRIMTGWSMENDNSVSLIELVCMTFSSICFLVAGFIGVYLHYIPESIAIVALSASCAGRVIYLLMNRRGK